MTRTGPNSWCVRIGDGYATTTEVIWHIGKKQSGWLLCVPAGFVFDSSVPRFLTWVLDPHDPRFLLSACIHDWLINKGYRRPFADAEWLDAARASHAPACLRGLAYIAMQIRAFALGKWGGAL